MNVLFARERHAGAKVAVLVSLYNYARYIRDSLDSVAGQSLEDIDLVVCNDCSTDDGARVTMDWMREHETRFARLALIENDVNSGLAATRNASIAYATAPYLFILDADNMLHPPCLERSLEVLEESEPTAAFAYAQREMFSESEPCGYALENLEDWSASLLARGNPTDAMVLHKRPALETVGGYAADDCFGRLGWEDFELWFKYARAGFYGIKLHQPLIRYRYHRASMGRTTTDRQKNMAVLWQRLRELYPEFFP